MSLDFSILIATPNGSGSQSPNHILAKAFFRSGYSVGAKNIFPSNIAGLPTWFAIRVNDSGFSSMRRSHDLVLAKNSESYIEDIQKVKPGGFFLYDDQIKGIAEHLRSDCTSIAIPFRELTTSLSDSIKMRKLLSNTVYLGILCDLFGLNPDIVDQTLRDYFADKPHVIDLNLKALTCGRSYAATTLNKFNWPLKIQNHDGSKEKLFIDGNSAAALGALAGGCTFFSWYPITPATSLAENFGAFAESTRRDKNDNRLYAQVQAEDELSAINMVIGAGWAGSRAMTSTSGPGLSLMAEGAGLSYFAEIPAVIWDVQRAGPSTGLPTRTLQGDLRFAHHLSHGDTEHVVLLPSNPLECFEMAQTAFDIAEKLQTLVIVLSDLDIGMNYFVSENFKLKSADYERGKVLGAEDLNKIEAYARYRDTDGDGVGYRTLPGTAHRQAAYFTRGTAHNEKSGYSEDSENFKNLLDRLKKKISVGRKLLPEPEYNAQNSAAPSPVLIITYGSTAQITSEIKAHLNSRNISCDFLRLKSLPLGDEVEKFLQGRDIIFLIEQNRDAQMRGILIQRFPEYAKVVKSILQYDGLPISADLVCASLTQQMEKGPSA